MNRIYKGIHKFQESYFKKEEEFFQRLSQEQKPDVLFITCADSRVDPNLVTQSNPGEIFIVRNVGNIVPPHDAIKDKNSVAAALEFAVLNLKVTDIIVCGHSNCGAMKMLYEDEQFLRRMPHVNEWLQLSASMRDFMLKYYGNASDEIRQRVTEEENILFQLHNIQTYPFVKQALDEKTLYLHGWYYNIGTGIIYSYNTAEDVFEIINEHNMRGHK
jgi:carbonic anhydrase